jgi:hypothetical protein
MIMTAESYRPSCGSYIEWSTIFAGAVLACAISTVMLQFGAAVGLANVTPWLTADENINPGSVLGLGIWVLWIQLMSSLAGGYLAGRMRAPIPGATEHESDMRDGTHGLLVWATSTLVVVAVTSLGAALAALAVDPAADPTAEVQRVTELTDRQHTAQVIFAFAAGATSLVSAVVSWWAATMGGNHRDTQADHTRYFSFRVIR